MSIRFDIGLLFPHEFMRAETRRVDHNHCSSVLPRTRTRAARPIDSEQRDIVAETSEGRQAWQFRVDLRSGVEEGRCADTRDPAIAARKNELSVLICRDAEDCTLWEGAAVRLRVAKEAGWRDVEELAARNFGIL